jgi:hypothetical protein
MPLRAHCIHKYLRACCNISYFSLLITDGWFHRCVAAYASDWTFIETALRPHKHIPGRDEMQVLSLDHSYVTLLSPWVFSFLSVVFHLASINILATITLVGFGHWVSCYQSVQSGQISACLFAWGLLYWQSHKGCKVRSDFVSLNFSLRNSQREIHKEKFTSQGGGNCAVCGSTSHSELMNGFYMWYVMYSSPMCAHHYASLDLFLTP